MLYCSTLNFAQYLESCFEIDCLLPLRSTTLTSRGKKVVLFVLPSFSGTDEAASVCASSFAIASIASSQP